LVGFLSTKRFINIIREIAFQCSFHGSTKFYGDANIKLY
jgi:hypothetical protein